VVRETAADDRRVNLIKATRQGGYSKKDGSAE